MQPQAEFGFKELFAHIVGGMAKALSDREGETRQQQFARSQAAAHMIMDMLPRDSIEAMLAGHSVMFHELLIDSVHQTLRGELIAMQQGTRDVIAAMNKAFILNLDRLDQYRNRPATGRRDLPDRETVVSQGDPDLAGREDPADRGDRADRDQKAPVLSRAEQILADSPASAETIALIRTNPEAMAALEAGDNARFARALGLDKPEEETAGAAVPKGGTRSRR